MTKMTDAEFDFRHWLALSLHLTLSAPMLLFHTQKELRMVEIMREIQELLERMP